MMRRSWTTRSRDAARWRGARAHLGAHRSFLLPVLSHDRVGDDALNELRDLAVGLALPLLDDLAGEGNSRHFDSRRGGGGGISWGCISRGSC